MFDIFFCTVSYAASLGCRAVEHLAEEAFDAVERNHLQVVIQIDVASPGDDQQLLVVATEQFEGVLAEVARMLNI